MVRERQGRTGEHDARRRQPRGDRGALRSAPGERPRRLIAANAAKADEYHAGKTGLLGFFVGQVMRQSGGKANSALVSGLVQERLGG